MNIHPEFDDAIRAERIRVKYESNTDNSSSSVRDQSLLGQWASVMTHILSPTYKVESPEQLIINKTREDLEQVRDIDLGD